MNATTLIREHLAELKDRSAFTLANPADCFSPDSSTSAGASFLTLVRDSVAERIDDFADEVEAGRAEHADFGRMMEDVPAEVADVCVPTYTSDLWATFVDLGAYQEDASELGATAEDLDQCARVALYLIGQRLADALIIEAAEVVEDDEPPFMHADECPVQTGKLDESGAVVCSCGDADNS